MAGHSVEEIKKETRVYILVFVALAALTIVTVGISYLHLHFVAAIGLALFVALIKGSLVAGFFMHLISERKLVYWVLILTFIFFLALMLLPLGGFLDSTGS
ncbi:MAG: cytochrome C oxidase subunit IV family protein [Acidobacteriota bacterium]|jgi:cytochrome c oxidase subunit 4